MINFSVISSCKLLGLGGCGTNGLQNRINESSSSHRVHRAMRFSFIYTFVILFMMCFGLAGAQTAAPPAGSGTENDPYLITELGNLVWMSDTVTSSSGKYYKMINNINASATSAWNDGAGFVPIGTITAPFMGLFDGNRKKITGLTINRSSSSTDYVGLFGYTGTDCAIKDLGLEGGSVSGTSSSSSVYVGVLVGYTRGTITNCYASGAVSGTSTASFSDVYVGGLVGYQYSSGTIENCYASSSVSGTSSSSYVYVYIGGLVGYQDYGAITNCYASGEVSGTGSFDYDVFVGGLVGLFSGGTIANCYASGEVSGTGTGNSSSSVRVGGLVGYQAYGSTITNCYAIGSVSGARGVGGLVGHASGTITNCHATGSVSGSGDVGGLAGYQDYGEITNCYYDSQTTGCSDTGKGTPKTTAEMKQQITFKGWDFTDTWIIDEGASYPYLRAFRDEAILTVSVIGNGTVTPSVGVHSYAYGEVVSLSATADAGFGFIEWIGDNITDVNDANTTVVMDYNTSVTARFGKAIYTLADLQAVKDDLDGQYILMNDIDASETVSWNSGAGFVPIGTRPAPFTGLFDGNGKKITGLTINRSSAIPDYVGMFGFIEIGSTIKDLGLEGGSMSGTCTGPNSSVYVGGLVGHQYSGGTIENCYASGEVSGTGTGNSSSSVFVGGLVGCQDGGTITNCYASGRVSGTSGYSYVGGLVGSQPDVGTITNCYASGEVSGTRTGYDSSFVYVGGLVGYQAYGSTITNCYAIGSVSGSGDVGGLVGYQDYGAITNCYYDSQTTGCSDTDKGTPKTTAEMKQQSTFNDWDFVNTWGIEEGVDYPYLRSWPKPVTYTVTFDANGGSGTMSAQTFRAGVVQALKANTFSRFGYTFAGWNTNSIGTGTNYSDQQSITVSTSMTLYAKWNVFDLSLNSGDFTKGISSALSPGSIVDVSWDVSASQAVAAPVWFEVFGSKTGGFDQVRTGATMTSSYKKTDGLSATSSQVQPSNLLLNTVTDGVYTLIPSVNRATLKSGSEVAIPESDYTNNWLPIAGKRLSVHNPNQLDIDLSLSDVQVVYNPMQPTKIGFTGKVTNTGSVDMTKPGAWVEVFYGTLTAEGTLMPQGTIGAGQNINTLAAGAQADFTLSGTVPAGVMNRAFAVVADSTDIVPETNEVNNSQLFYDPLILPPGKDNGIDLAITNMTVDADQLAPNQVAPESNLKFSVTVQNKGTTMPSEQVYLELFASQNGGVSCIPGITLTWSEKITAPALGETQTYNFEKRINSIGDGMYTLVAEVNRDGAGTNPGDMTPLDNRYSFSGGRVFLNTPVVSGSVNLVWSEGPTFTQSNGKMTVSGTIKNVGNATTRAFWTEAFVGTMQEKTGYFYKDTNTVFAGGINCTLKANEEKAITLTGTVPAGKVVGVLADSTDVVAETDETDNYDYSELTK